jgi:hypothetical protein
MRLSRASSKPGDAIHRAPSGRAERLAGEMDLAECIVFLGFAYHPQSMRLLEPALKINAKPIFGTAYKLSESDVSIVHAQLFQLFATEMPTEFRHASIKLENKQTCSDLFDHYARSLSGS